jgi:acid phosphatase (class A)
MSLRRLSIATGLALALGFAGTVFAADRLEPGYLAKGGMPDTSRIVQGPPGEDTAAQRWDWDVFLATRKLQSQTRWDQAQSDVDTSMTALMRDFSCAVGARLDETSAPLTQQLLTRARSDAAVGSSRAKAQYRRERPFVGNFQPICVDRDADLAASPSFPSGHATLGWALGLILAELAPDRATEILARARAYGESRVVCGVHFVSDIEAGRLTGSSVVAAEHGQPDFLADVDKAREELKALRANPASEPYPGQCAAEAELTKRPW